MKVICAWFLVVSLLFLSPSAVAQTTGEPDPKPPDLSNTRVLVLHSYHQGFTWTDNISRGILSAFSAHADTVEVIFEFMDTRRIFTDEYFDYLQEIYHLKYDGKKIDVIIASDDQAFNFMLGPGQEIFPGVPIVFASVSGYDPSMRENDYQLTGLVEAIDIADTLETALRLHPETKDVAVITDITRTGQALKAKAETVFQDFEGRVQLKFLEHRTVDELVPQVSSLSDNTIVFLFIFSRDQTGRVISHEHRLQTLVEYCNVPIYSVWEFYIGHGIVGGKLTSGEEEGRIAGTMALRILSGESAADIPLERSPSRYVFDYTYLDRFGVDESRLPEGSIIINKPFSFYEEYKYLIWRVIAVIVFLLFIVAILMGNIMMRRRAEAALAESEARFRTIVDGLNDAIFIHDINTDAIVDVNNKMCEMYGYTREEARQIDIETVSSGEKPYTQAEAMGWLEKAKAGEPQMFPWRAKDKQGRLFWVEVNMRRATIGDQDRILVAVRDITKRVQAEEALRESEERFRTLVNSMDDIIFTLDHEQRHVGVFGHWIENQGLTPEMFLGKTASEILGPEAAVVHEAANRRALAGENVVYEWSIETSEARQFYQTSVSPLRDSQGEIVGIVGVGRDITQRKQAEEAMLQASRLETAATLAGGIAHKVNNLMTAVLGYAELLRNRLSGQADITTMLDTIYRSAQQAGDLAQQMLAFARGGKYRPQTVNLNDTIQEMVRIQQRSLSTQICVEQHLTADLWLVQADPTQMSQVFLNLFSNASEAIEHEGTIIISTENIMVDQPLDQYDPALTPGPYICLSVQDTGRGMKEETLARVFEPFFTTKFQGRGMGLAAVYGIIDNHGGHITATSQPSQGSTFKVYLPAIRIESKPTPVAETDKDRFAPVSTKTPPTILVVEDEEMVLKLLDEILKAWGFQSLLAHSGQEAVEIAETYPGEIHLAMLDMGMPVLDGADTVLLLKQARPDMKAILCSGYELDEKAQSVLDAGASAFIQKPFEMDVLAAEIQRTLSN